MCDFEPCVRTQCGIVLRTLVPLAPLAKEWRQKSRIGNVTENNVGNIEIGTDTDKERRRNPMKESKISKLIDNILSRNSLPRISESVDTYDQYLLQELADKTNLLPYLSKKNRNNKNYQKSDRDKHQNKNKKADDFDDIDDSNNNNNETETGNETEAQAGAGAGAETKNENKNKSMSLGVNSIVTSHCDGMQAVRPYQWDGISWLLHLYHCGLGGILAGVLTFMFILNYYNYICAYCFSNLVARFYSCNYCFSSFLYFIFLLLYFFLTTYLLTLFIHLFIYLFIYLLIYEHICSYIYLFTYLFIYLFDLLIYIFIHIFI